MLLTAFILAILVTIGFVILFYKLPVWLRSFLSRRYILLDIIIAWIVFTTMGFAIVGIAAAGFIALFVSGYLYWYKSYKATQKDTYQPQKKPHTKRHIYYTAKLYNWYKGRI